MSIASALASAQQKVANAYTAISNKGGTLPATQNLANMPTAINSIPVTLPKFGLTIDNFIGNVNGNGMLASPTAINGITFTGVVDFLNGDPLRGAFAFRNDLTGEISFPDLTSISYRNCWYPLLDAFRSTRITKVSCPNLVTISKYCMNAFRDCAFLSQINLQSLKSIEGSRLCSDMFNGCGTDSSVSELVVDLSSLETVAGTNGFSQIAGFFKGCTKLITLSLTKLTTITGNWATDGMLADCNNLTSLYLSAFTTTTISTNSDAIKKIFNNNTASSSGTCTVHFPSNLQSAVSGLTGYPAFGGNSSRIVLAFDLPATS